jgi:hypothetical protein
MQKTILTFLLLSLTGVFCFLFIACNKEVKQPCEDNHVSATATTSDPCIAQGIITISSPLGAHIQYRSGNSTFQSSPVFGPLLPGNYTIIAKEENGCIHRSDIIVLPITPGSLFNVVKTVLADNCITCHGGSNPQAGIDFARNCDIINNWDRIKARAVDGIPTPMPQGGLLPVNERIKIMNWVNAGHRFTD